MTDKIKEEKRIQIKRLLKEKLGTTSISDLLLLDVRYNGGMFGCTNSQSAECQEPSDPFVNLSG